MSERSSRLVVWIALVLALPLPLFGLEQAIVPAARSLMLAAICLLVIGLESANGVVPVLAALFLAQALLQLGLLWIAARLLVRALARLAPRWRTGLVAAAVALLLLAGSRIELYRTPYRAASLHATLLEVFE